MIKLRKYLIIILSLSSVQLISQKKVPKSQVVLRAGLFSTILDGEVSGKFYSNFRHGYAFGTDLHLVDEYIIIAPGFHVVNFPRQNSSINSKFLNLTSDDDFAFHLPVRIGLYALNLDKFRIFFTGGVYGLYFLDHMISRLPDKMYNIRLAGGWNLQTGIIIKPFILNVDYNSTFGSAQTINRFKMQNIHLTIGFLL